nr:helix-turn-helix transcriptional regulator [Arthrobacter gengyunqii]
MDQKDLSEAAGMERSTLNRYLKGRRALPALTLFKVAGCFGMAPSELLREAEARVKRAHSSVHA